MGKGKTLEDMNLMRILPRKGSKWVPPPPEERVSTANVLDQSTARGLASEEESKKRNQGPAHQHIDRQRKYLTCITRGPWFDIFLGLCGSRSAIRLFDKMICFRRLCE